MKFSFEIHIGLTKFTITEDAESHQDFIKKAAFFTGLPQTGPGGETDLKLVHRTTKEGFEFYSIVSEQAQKEFKFGQYKDHSGLFSKGWEDLYVANNQQYDDQQDNNQHYGNQQENYAPTNQYEPAYEQPHETPQQQQIQAPPPQRASAQSPRAPAPPQRNLAPPHNQGRSPGQTASQRSPAVSNVLAKYGIKR